MEKQLQKKVSEWTREEVKKFCTPRGIKFIGIKRTELNKQIEKALNGTGEKKASEKFEPKGLIDVAVAYSKKRITLAEKQKWDDHFRKLAKGETSAKPEEKKEAPKAKVKQELFKEIEDAQEDKEVIAIKKMDISYSEKCFRMFKLGYKNPKVICFALDNPKRRFACIRAIKRYQENDSLAKLAKK